MSSWFSARCAGCVLAGMLRFVGVAVGSLPVV